MVVRQCQIHHRADFDFAVHGHRSFLDLVHAENSGLRRIEYGRRHQGAVNASVRYRKCSALHIGQCKLAFASHFAKFGDACFHLGKCEPICVANHRNYQPVGRAHCYAHMHEPLVDDIGPVDLRIHFGNFHERSAASLHEKRHEAEPCPVLLLEHFLVVSAHLHDVGHVHFVVRG